MSTDPEALALALLSSDRRPLVRAWCPQPARADRCRLGVVFDLPTGPVLAVPGFDIEACDLLPGRPNDGPMRFRAWAYPVDGERDVYSRCQHGTYLLQLEDIRARIARARRERRPVDTVGSWTGHPGWTGEDC